MFDFVQEKATFNKNFTKRKNGYNFYFQLSDWAQMRAAIKRLIILGRCMGWPIKTQLLALVYFSGWTLKIH